MGEAFCSCGGRVGEIGDMVEDEEGSAEAVRKDLDVSSRPLAAGGPGAGEGEVGFDVGFYFCGLRAEEEEEAEQSEGEGPRVQGVDDCGEDRGEDAERGQRFVEVGAVDEGEGDGDSDLVPHSCEQVS